MDCQETGCVDVHGSGQGPVVGFYEYDKPSGCIKGASFLILDQLSDYWLLKKADYSGL